MSEPQTMYRASVYFGSLSLWHPDTPVNVLCTSMKLSACGRYVQRTQQKLDRQGWETIQEEMSGYWQPTEAGAAAAIAPRLRQIGERLIRQAEELEANAASPGHSVDASDAGVATPAEAGIAGSRGSGHFTE